LPLLPLAGALADLGENLIITVLLLAYPIALYWLVYLANLFTLLKWLAVLLSIFLILLGAGAYLLIRFNKRKDKLLSGDLTHSCSPTTHPTAKQRPSRILMRPCIPMGR
jgi:hypothetical protein